MEQYIPKSAVLAEIETLKGKIDSHDDYANGWHNALTSVETDIDFLDTKDKNLNGTEIIHESMSKALDDYKVSSELFDVATEYIRNTLPRFDKKFPVKSNEISAAIFFGANWERQMILDKVCWWLNNNRLGVIDDDYINKLRKELED